MATPQSTMSSSSPSHKRPRWASLSGMLSELAALPEGARALDGEHAATREYAAALEEGGDAAAGGVVQRMHGAGRWDDLDALGAFAEKCNAQRLREHLFDHAIGPALFMSAATAGAYDEAQRAVALRIPSAARCLASALAGLCRHVATAADVARAALGRPLVVVVYGAGRPRHNTAVALVNWDLALQHHELRDTLCIAASFDEDARLVLSDEFEDEHERRPKALARERRDAFKGYAGCVSAVRVPACGAPEVRLEDARSNWRQWFAEFEYVGETGGDFGEEVGRWRGPRLDGELGDWLAGRALLPRLLADGLLEGDVALVVDNAGRELFGSAGCVAALVCDAPQCNCE